MYWYVTLCIGNLFYFPFLFLKSLSWFRVNTFFQMQNILYINLYLKKHMEETSSKFIQAKYTNSG